MATIFYCPVCGSESSRIASKCPKCNTNVSPIESKYDIQYYLDESVRQYSHCGNFFRILHDKEIKHNPYFNQKEYERARGIISEETDKLSRKFVSNNQPNVNVPKCPTCQSSNIKRISNAKKAVHGFAFGLFSKTAQSQFECCNCGYKW